MTNELKPVVLKTGEEKYHTKNGDRHVFVDKMVTMASWQIAILIFIAVFAILMNFFQITYAADGFNKVLKELKDIKAQTGAGDESLVFCAPSNEDEK